MSKEKRRLPDPIFYSRQECAELLGCGLSKIDAAIRENTLPSFKWGGDRKVHRKDLDDFAWDLRNSGLADYGLEV